MRIFAERDDIRKAFLENPKIAGSMDLLRDLGVMSFVDSLADSIWNYKMLFEKGMEIFDRTDIDGILEIAVRQLSDLYLPSFIAFAWKPVQTHADITLRLYRDYKPVSLQLNLDSIAVFESFFSEFSEPVYFAEMEKKLGDSDAIAQLREMCPEIVVPIAGPFSLYGIILIGSKTGGKEYAPEEMEFIKNIVFFVSQAIKNHLYYEHSLRDIKTGLYNHGFFMTRMKEEVADLRRNLYASSIIMVDVDRFKDFNDTYGHLAGDKVLESLAQVIRHNIRTNDIPSRFGGEEFTILLPNAESSAALLVAERLRVSVTEMEVPWEIPLPAITISLGIFTFDNGSDMETNDIISRADEALYASKARGRNRTTVWEPGFIDGISDKK